MDRKKPHSNLYEILQFPPDLSGGILKLMEWVKTTFQFIRNLLEFPPDLSGGILKY